MFEAVRNHFQIELFHGTTLENYQTATSIEGKKIVFDKRKVIQATTAGTYLVKEDFSYCARHALRRARELHHTPLVLSTFLSKRSPYVNDPRYKTWVWLPPGQTVEVEKIWLPKPDFLWNQLEIVQLPQDLSSLFTQQPNVIDNHQI